MKLSCAYDTYLADVNSSIIATANSKDNGGFTEWSKVRTKCRTKTCANIFNKFRILKVEYYKKEIEIDFFTGNSKEKFDE